MDVAGASDSTATAVATTIAASEHTGLVSVSVIDCAAAAANLAPASLKRDFKAEVHANPEGHHCNPEPRIFELFSLGLLHLSLRLGRVGGPVPAIHAWMVHESF